MRPIVTYAALIDRAMPTSWPTATLTTATKWRVVDLRLKQKDQWLGRPLPSDVGVRRGIHGNGGGRRVLWHDTGHTLWGDVGGMRVCMCWPTSMPVRPVYIRPARVYLDGNGHLWNYCLGSQ